MLVLDSVDPDGIGRSALGARPGEVWLVRPDAHVAAVVTSTEALVAAVERTLGLLTGDQIPRADQPGGIMSMTTLARPSGSTTLSTADVESGRGFDYWADAVTSTFVPLECRTQQSAAFHGDLVNRSLGDFQFTLVSAEAHRVARTRRMIALNDPGLMKVCLQVRGSGRINQDGREAEIFPGDLTMYDTSRPYVLSFDHNPRRLRDAGVHVPAGHDGPAGRRDVPAHGHPRQRHGGDRTRWSRRSSAGSRRRSPRTG